MNLSRYTLLYICLLLACLPLGLASCSSDDDVVEIFTGKTWKLSYISAEGNHKWIDLWGTSDEAYQASMKLLEVEDNFTLGFSGSEVEGATSGTLTGQGVRVRFTGTWRADGESRELMVGLQATGTESDVLAKEFLNGLRNVVRYGGDAKNLFIYYKQGQVTRFMGFTPQ